MDLGQRIAALANDKRLAVLRWLAEPRAHFPPQVHADIEEVGVCGVFIADKLGVTPATASAHMKLLVDAGFVTARRIGKWTYFKREDAALAAIGRDLTEL
jgi:ArsR family transcriptional regulator